MSQTHRQSRTRTRPTVRQGQAQLRATGACVDPMLPALAADQIQTVQLAASVFDADGGHRVTRDRHGARCVRWYCSRSLPGRQCLLRFIGMNLSELRSPHAGSRPPGRGDLVKAGAVVAVGNPDGLAVGEAGSGGEAHRIGCVWLYCSRSGVSWRTMPHGQGRMQVPQGCLR